MKFLQEVLRGVHRMDDEPDETDDLDLDPELEVGEDPEMSDPIDGEEPPADDEFDDSELLADDPTEDPMAGFSDPTSGGGSGGDGGESDLPADVAPEDGNDEMAQLDDVASNATEDPDRQGAIRTVKKAHLVYKRESGDGGFEELWVYNIGTMKDELETRKAILAGTDIPPGKTTSPDGTQTYSIWSTGNAEMLSVKGLPN
jgi:hypothetical protein